MAGQLTVERSTLPLERLQGADSGAQRPLPGSPGSHIEKLSFRLPFQTQGVAAIADPKSSAAMPYRFVLVNDI